MSTKIYKQFLAKQLARSGNQGNDFTCPVTIFTCPGQALSYTTEQLF
jgi:hypothetical protein